MTLGPRDRILISLVLRMLGYYGSVPRLDFEPCSRPFLSLCKRILEIAATKECSASRDQGNANTKIAFRKH
jgi:hypothetical protein